MTLLLAITLVGSVFLFRLTCADETDTTTAVPEPQPEPEPETTTPLTTPSTKGDWVPPNRPMIIPDLNFLPNLKKTDDGVSVDIGSIQLSAVKLGEVSWRRISTKYLFHPFFNVLLFASFIV